MVNCGLGEIVDAQAVVITQDGNDIELLTSTGDTLVGTIFGDLIDWTGDIDERGGTTTFTSANLTVSGDFASGNAAWTWTDGTDSCNGTMDITVQRNIAELDLLSNSFPNIAQQLAIINNVGFVTGTLNIADDGRDYFGFTLAADATVQAELAHFDTQASDLWLEIIDANENQIVVSDSADSFEVVVAQLPAGSYFVGVHANTTTGVQPYNLSVDVN